MLEQKIIDLIFETIDNSGLDINKFREKIVNQYQIDKSISNDDFIENGKINTEKFSERLGSVYKKEARNYFTISSKNDFNFLIQNSDIDNIGRMMIFSPLNDHSRYMLKKGDILFCYRQGQFDSLSLALEKRGIYGVGIAASDPLLLYPEEERHERYGVFVYFPFPLKKHLQLRNIQLHPQTIDLTPYNGNRNDALQHIQESRHYETLLQLITSANPHLMTAFENLLDLEIAKVDIPDKVWENKNNLKFEATDYAIGISTILKNSKQDEDVLDRDDDVLEFEGEETLEPSFNSDGYGTVVKVDRAQYSIYELVRNIKREKIILDPSFQRNDVWTSVQQSELVESVLMGIPLPLIYLSERKTDGKIIVVDGRQRLTAFKKFLENDLRLKSLKVLTNLNKLNFSVLDDKLKSNFEDFQIVTHIIKPPTSDRLKFEIFDRVNRKGTQLNNQEMRNALYQGKATELLKDLCKVEEFKSSTGYSINSKRMKDAYIILRYISFYSWRMEVSKDENGNIIEYKSDIDDFLGKSMDFFNQATDSYLFQLRKNFISVASICNSEFGEDGFRLPSSSIKRRPINMLLFESIMYLLTLTLNIKEQIDYKSLYDELLSNEDFLDTIYNSTDSSKMVIKRFEIIEKIYEEITNHVRKS